MEKNLKKTHLTYIGIALLSGLGLGYMYALIMTPEIIFELDSPIINSVSFKDPMLGKEDALVTIVEFSNYQCEFCKDFYQNSFHRIIETYVDKGKANFTFKDFPLETYPQSVQAATAANCAQEQEKYWEMHNILFQKQEEWSYSEQYEEKFYEIASEAGVEDIEKFKRCYKSEKYNQEISNDAKDGIKQGVKYTPTFFINGKKIVGAQHILTFETIINKELAILEPIGPAEVQPIGPPEAL